MRLRHFIACSLAAAVVCGVAGAQENDSNTTPKNSATRPATTQPATSPTTRPDPRLMSSDQMLGQMLRPATHGQPKPLQPALDVPSTDKTSGAGAVKPNAPVVATLREGTYVIDRVGRLEKNADGSQSQFVFEADGKSLREPPLVIVPNLKLMMMENAVTGASRDLKFRISGMITEYRGRNFVVIEKVFVEPDSRQQF